jgi:small conductance mechanosensitive channel
MQGESPVPWKMYRSSTILRTPDNVKVIVPDSAVINNSIKNYSAYGSRRVDLVVGVSYQDNIDLARNTLMNMMASHALVLTDPPPSVEVLGLAESSVNLVIHAWSLTEHYAQVRSDLLEGLKLCLDESGIRIPYPQQVVHVYQSGQIEAR